MFQDGALYAVEFDDGVKIGISINVKQRIETYKHPWCKPIRSIHYIECRFPKYAEQFMKNYFKHSIRSKYSTEYITNVKLEIILNKMEEARHCKPEHASIGEWFTRTIIKVL